MHILLKSIRSGYSSVGSSVSLIIWRSWVQSSVSAIFLILPSTFCRVDRWWLFAWKSKATRIRRCKNKNLVRSGIEPETFCVWSRRDSHYTTGLLHQNLFKHAVLFSAFLPLINRIDLLLFFKNSHHEGLLKGIWQNSQNGYVSSVLQAKCLSCHRAIFLFQRQ